MKYGLLGREFDYFKYPEGTHCIYKTFCTTKFTTLASVGWATWHVLGRSTAKTWQETALYYPQFVVPGVATGFMWGATVCFMANERKKDDEYNYMAGGMASGAMLGACRGSYSVGGYAMLLGGFFSYAWKYWKQTTNNLPMIPDNVYPTYGEWDSVWFHHYDKKTLIPDPGLYDGSEDLV